MRPTLLFLCLALLPGAALAQWQQVAGPYGGTVVSSLIGDSDGALLAATYGGLFRSDDDGHSWRPDADGIAASGVDVRDLLVQNDGMVLAATYGGGIYRRPSGSTTWTGIGSRWVFATSLVETESGSLFAGTIDGVIRSQDGGNSWLNISIGGRSVLVTDMAARGPYVFASSREGIYRSSDNGLTWDYESMGMNEFNTTTLHVTTSGTIFAGTSPIAGGCSLYRSRSDGRLWTCIQPSPNPLRIGAVTSDALGRVYVGGYRLVYRSDNEGDRWTQANSSPTTVHALTVSGSTVLAGTFGRGVVRSPDRGATWTPTNEGLNSAITEVLAGADGSVFAATVGGVFRTDDSGQSWTLLDDVTQPVRSSQTIGFDPEGRLLVGTLNGLLRTDPAGGPWEVLGPPGNPGIRDITLGPAGDIYVGYWEGVYHLQGNRWESMPLVGPDQATRDVISVTVDAAGNLYAGASYDSFVMPTGSADWRRMQNSSSPYFEVQTFAQDANGEVFAGTRYFGVLRSSDGGETWFQMQSGLNGTEDVRSISFDDDGTAFLGTFGNGVYRFDAASNNWMPDNAGMEASRRVMSLIFDASGRSWAGTYGGGLFVRSAAGSTAGEFSASVPRRFSVTSLHPNPASDHVTLEMDVPISGSLRVSAYDLLGRRMTVQDVDGLRAGYTQRVRVPLGPLTPGLYLLRIEMADFRVSRPVVVMR